MTLTVIEDDEYMHWECLYWESRSWQRLTAEEIRDVERKPFEEWLKKKITSRRIKNFWKLFDEGELTEINAARFMKKKTYDQFKKAGLFQESVTDIYFKKD